MPPGTRNRFAPHYCRSPNAVHRLKDLIDNFVDSWTIFVRRSPYQSKFPPSHAHEQISAPFNYSGITIIELMIVIGILAALATISIPNILGETPKFRLNGASQQVFVDLMSARMKAVSNNRKIKVFFTNDNQYKICQDINNDEIVDDCEGSLKLIDIQKEYHGVTMTSTNNPIFHPRGNASNLATISLTNSSGTKNITIAITGRVRIS